MIHRWWDRRWAADLDGLLASNAAKATREQLTLIRIFEELRGRGYDGGYDAVRRTSGDGARSADKRQRRPMSR